MRTLTTSRLPAASVLCGLLAACADSGSSAVSDPENAVVITAEQAPYGSMASAPFRTKYRGTRRYEVHYQVGGVDTVLEYREEVGSDGQGQFAIETLAVLSVVDDPDLFLVLQDQRQGFTYRYRDFQVRDLDLFVQNYSAAIVNDSTVVAGTRCARIHVQRRDAPVRYYSADVHLATGLVLRWEEREISNDALLALMEFETFQLDADVSDMDLRDRLFPATPIDLSGNTAAQIGFEVLQPADLPAGFEIEIAESLVDGMGRTWAKLVYGDGVDRAVYMHRAQTTGEIADGLVESLTVGAWTALLGDVNGYPLIAMGKVPVLDLLDMLKSAQ